MAILELILELLGGVCDMLIIDEFTRGKDRTALWVGLTILSVVIVILVAVWTLK
jgi:hypothetical protein